MGVRREVHTQREEEEEKGDESGKVESPFNPRSHHAGGLRVMVHSDETELLGNIWQPKHEVEQPRLRPLFRDSRTAGIKAESLFLHDL